MLYVDIPTPSEIASLIAIRGPACVSIYLPTTNLTNQIGAARIEMSNLLRDADEQLEAAGVDKRTRSAIAAEFAGLDEDEEFWAHQATSLAVFAQPGSHRTYRLPTRLSASVHVSDRLHLTPLYRLTSQPHHAFILALEEDDVRLIEMFTDLDAQELKVPNMPKDAASAAGVSSINNRTAGGTQENAHNMMLRKYARKIDAALRPMMAGRSESLILAAVEPVNSMFRSENSYSHLADERISVSPGRLSAKELAEEARPIIDRIHAAAIADFHDVYAARGNSGRAASDITDIARAATFGAVDTLVLDIDEVVPGTIDEETGAVTFADDASGKTYGVIDEIAGRVLQSGGTVIGVRREDVPGGGALAAVLRYAI